MARLSLNGYRKQWPRIGGVIDLRPAPLALVRTSGWDQ